MKYLAKLDAERSEKDTVSEKGTTELYATRAQVDGLHRIKENFKRYDQLIELVKTPISPVFNYKFLLEKYAFAVATDTPPCILSIKRATKAVSDYYKACTREVNGDVIIEKRIWNLVCVHEKAAKEKKEVYYPFLVFLMIHACKLSIDTQREADYNSILPKRTKQYRQSGKKENLCLRSFEREYSHQLELMANLCQAFDLGPEECKQNWNLFFQKQSAIIQNQELLDIWRNIMEVQNLSYEDIPLIGQQLFIIDCLATCIPMNLERMSYNKVYSEYRGGAFREYILQERERLIAKTKSIEESVVILRQLESAEETTEESTEESTEETTKKKTPWDVISNYGQCWNDAQYSDRGIKIANDSFFQTRLCDYWDLECIDKNDKTRKLKAIFEEEHTAVENVEKQELDERKRFEVEFCLQLIHRKAALEKLIAGVDYFFKFKLGNVLTEEWLYDVLTS